MTSRARVRGAAMVEAVCILPVLALLLLGVMHLHRMHASDRRLAQQTRQCAMLYARSGCDDAVLPPECEDAFQSAGGTDEEGRQSLFAGATDTVQQRGVETSLFDQADDLPVLGTVFEALFGRGEVAELTAETPGMGPGESLRLRARHHILCDVKPTEGDDVAEQLFHELSPFEEGT